MGGSKSAPGEAAKPGRKVPWLWWGIAGGLAAGTAVAGVITLGAQGDLNDKKDNPASKKELDDAASRTRTMAIVTDVLLVGTLATAGIATYLTFGPQKETPPSEVSVGIGPASVRVSGSF